MRNIVKETNVYKQVFCFPEKNNKETKFKNKLVLRKFYSENKCFRNKFVFRKNIINITTRKTGIKHKQTF